MVTRKGKENAENAENPQNTQRIRRIRRESAEYAETGWECGDDANFVVYATIPARFLKQLNISAIEHRVIA